MIQDWELTYPNRKAIIFNALQNISPSHLLDKNIFDFLNLSTINDVNQLDWLKFNFFTIVKLFETPEKWYFELE